jgi:release factor glutamine methyltransferase
MIYEPREDSHLLQKTIKPYAKGTVLDMGTGSGIQAVEARKYTFKVLGVDIDPEVIKECKKKFPTIEFRTSNLFSNVREKFNLITFNPPYLPEDPMLKDIALDGGPLGYEVIEAFLIEAKEHLNNNGTILLLFSSLSHKNKIHEILKREKYSYKEIANEKMAFEELYVYEVK